MTPERSTRPFLIVAAATIVAAAVALLGLQLRESAAPDGPAESSSVLNKNTGPAGDVHRRPDGHPLVLGSNDAPVTLVVFSELTCPYCIYFATEIQPKLVERYVKPGKLRIEWRDAPASGPTARLTARAGRAAAEQDRFWQFTDAAARAAREGPLTVDDLVDLAATVGVKDLATFRNDITGDRFDPEIDADLRTAQRLFVPPSPAFWVEGTPLLSGLPLRAFTDVIDGKLLLTE